MKDFSNDFFDDLPDYIPVQEAFQNVVNIPFNAKIIVSPAEAKIDPTVIKKRPHSI